MDNKDRIYEDLQYIKKIIDDSRNIVIDNGIGFIIWGVIIIIGLAVTYLDIVIEGNQHSFGAWLALILFGWLQSFYSWRKNRSKKTRITFAGKLLAAIWVSAGIAMTITGFIGTSAGAYKSVFISPIISIILGMAFYISALLYENKFMKYIAPIWWLGGIYMFLFPGIHTILVMALMMIVLQVIPGIIIYRKYKTEQVFND